MLAFRGRSSITAAAVARCRASSSSSSSLFLLGGSHNSRIATTRIEARRWLATDTTAPAAATTTINTNTARNTYTIRVEGHFDETKAKALQTKDIISLFGAFEPYNITLLPPNRIGGGEKYKAKKGPSIPAPPSVLATFQVPSLRFAQEIAKSFHHDETWGERITVHQEEESFPVFISGLPTGVSSDELKQQIEAAAACDPKQMKAAGEPEAGGEFDPEAGAPSESFLARTPIEVYESYALFRCPDQYSSLGLLQGAFQLTPADQVGKGGKKKNKGGNKGGGGAAGAAAAAAPTPEAELAAATVGEGEKKGEGDEGEGGEVEDAKAVLSYAAWKTYPVRVNCLPADVTVEEVYTTFKRYMPYDIDLLPPVGGGEEGGENEKATRSAYLRFARLEQAKECTEEMMNFTYKGSTLFVRQAFDNVFPVLVETSSGKMTQEELGRHVYALRAKKFTVLDYELLEEGTAAVIKFKSQYGADDGLKALKARLGGAATVTPAWRDFRLDLVNLPGEMTDDELKELVHLTNPSKVTLNSPTHTDTHTHTTGKRTASLSFPTRVEADLAFSQLSGSGIPDLKLRKAWAVYRLKVKGLPLDTTEEDIKEVLRGYEPFRIDFPRSKKGNLKGEAVLRFSAYDEVVAAISRLYGRDSPVDEAESKARWETASDGFSFDDPVGSLEEEMERMEMRGSAASSLSGKGVGGKGPSAAQVEIDRMVEKALEEEGTEALLQSGGGKGVMMEDGEEDEARLLGGVLGGGEGEGLEEEEEEEEEEGRDQDAGGVNPFGIYPEGKWVKMLVDTDTTQKIIKGGHILSYRALVVVGNLNGCGGWGIGKGANMEEAKARAYRAAKKNLIHVDLYRNRCVTTALYGKHNNCRIYIQAGHPKKPHKEGRMINDIIRMFGVECGEARSVGRRNPYSVVRAVFDAMSKHQGVEEISRKRGRRLISVSKARYLGL